MLDAAIEHFDNVWIGLFCKNCGRREYCSNTIVAFNMSDAMLFDKSASDKMLKLLKAECELLTSKGFLEFESVYVK